MEETDKQLKVLLAASGGGHLRQLLQLEDFWADQRYVFVTEETALGRSVAEEHPTHFTPHFALGQARLGDWGTMIAAAFQSMIRSFGIVRKERPDMVVTTGAGAQVFIVLFARLLGARIVLIDSLARFDRPSAFARLAGPLAHLRIAQSARAAVHWRGALVYEPLQEKAVPSQGKGNLLVATAGATLPFPRLVDTVLQAKANGTITEDVLLQVVEGAESIGPMGGVRVVNDMPYTEMQAVLERARYAVCHGGTGSIVSALSHRCKVIAMPRSFSKAEHYDEHQREICQAFRDRDLVEIASDLASFEAAYAALQNKSPKAVKTDYSGLTQILRDFAQHD